MKRRLLATLLAVVMILTFVGCGSAETGTGKNPTSGKQEEETVPDLKIGPNELPADSSLDLSKSYYKRYDGVEFTYAGKASGTDLPEGQTVDSNEYTWYWQAVTGSIPKTAWHAEGNAFEEKRSAAIANGEIPDLFNVTLDQYYLLVEAGLLADLTDAFENELSPNTKAMYEAGNNAALDLLKVDGKIYGIPQVYASGDGACLAWIRKDWMDKLNLEEPKTVADLETIAKAFMEKDPDGDGNKNTYGLGVTANYDATYGSALSNLILNMGGAAPGCWQVQENGEVIYGSLMDGAKNALTTLNDWYNKGLIAEDFATWTDDDLVQLTTTGNLGIIFCPWWSGVGNLASSVNSDPEADWIAYALPEEEGGVVRVEGGGPVYNIWVVSEDFDQPEMFIHAYNMLNDTKYHTENNFSFSISGSYGVMMECIPPNQFDIFVEVIEKGAAGEIETLEEANAYAYDHGLNGDVSEPWYYAVPAMNAEDKRAVEHEGESVYQLYLCYGVGMRALAKADKEFITTAFQGTTESMEMYSAFLLDYEKAEYTKMIMGDIGDMTISEYFDEFVKNYLAQGGAEITAEVQEFIDAQ